MSSYTLLALFKAYGNLFWNDVHAHSSFTFAKCGQAGVSLLNLQEKDIRLK